MPVDFTGEIQAVITWLSMWLTTVTKYSKDPIMHRIRSSFFSLFTSYTLRGKYQLLWQNRNWQSKVKNNKQRSAVHENCFMTDQRILMPCWCSKLQSTLQEMVAHLPTRKSAALNTDDVFRNLSLFLEVMHA